MSPYTIQELTQDWETLDMPDAANTERRMDEADMYFDSGIAMVLQNCVKCSRLAP
jgi:hypothetical protein